VDLGLKPSSVTYLLCDLEELFNFSESWFHPGCTIHKGVELRFRQGLSSPEFLLSPLLDQSWR
jgi:hypothetical protein